MKARAAPRIVATTPDEDENEDEDDEGVGEGDDEGEGEGEQLDALQHGHLEPHRKARDAMQFRSQGFKAPKDLPKRLEGPVHSEKKRAGGYVYTFERNTAPGHLKIGKPEHAYGSRMEEISKTRDYDASYVREWSMASKARAACAGDETALKAPDEARAGGAPLFTGPLLAGPGRV